MSEKNIKLVIAEKTSVAQSIAKVIGADKREDGYLEGKRLCLKMENLSETQRSNVGRVMTPTLACYIVSGRRHADGCYE